VALYRDRGVVLRTIKLGEADRIVTILTPGQGKVRAVAKGIRKPTSRFGARLEPTSHVALQCYRGRELDVVTQVETIDAFRPLREHYGSLTHAISMLEAVDQVAQEREPNPALYRMLVGALRTLAAAPSPMVAPAFFWKLLSLEGFHPVLDTCTRCGDDAGPFVAFDFGEGGVLCGECARRPACRGGSDRAVASHPRRRPAGRVDRSARPARGRGRAARGGRARVPPRTPASQRGATVSGRSPQGRRRAA
jgi:DNA repair protein RecO (recombination protein O)